MPSGGALGIFFATSSISHIPTMSEPAGCGAALAAADGDLAGDSKFALTAPMLPGVFPHPACALGTKATVRTNAPSVAVAVCNSLFTFRFISNLLIQTRKNCLYGECGKIVAGRSRMVLSADLKV